MKSKTLIILIILFILIAGGIGLIKSFKENKNPETGNSADNLPQGSLPDDNFEEFSPPMDRWSERITKKPFGIKISPNNSPVSPERFSGYHTGVDFETFPDEQNEDLEIKAVCSGSLLEKRYVSGYGGMVVEACKLKGQDITVIYGHLKLVSIEAEVNQQISTGSKIGILGKGYSAETDNERKHLHLGIHKGAVINVAGYVQNPAELDNWIDITKYLK